MKKMFLILLGCGLMSCGLLGCGASSESSLPADYNKSSQPAKVPEVMGSGGGGAPAPPPAPSLNP